MLSLAISPEISVCTREGGCEGCNQLAKFSIQGGKEEIRVRMCKNLKPEELMAVEDPLKYSPKTVPNLPAYRNADLVTHAGKSAQQFRDYLDTLATS